jgi:hypothetical protein
LRLATRLQNAAVLIPYPAHAGALSEREPAGTNMLD